MERTVTVSASDCQRLDFLNSLLTGGPWPLFGAGTRTFITTGRGDFSVDTTREVQVIARTLPNDATLKIFTREDSDDHSE